MKRLGKCEVCNKREAGDEIKGACGLCSLFLCDKCNKLYKFKDIYGWIWYLNGKHYFPEDYELLN